MDTKERARQAPECHTRASPQFLIEAKLTSKAQAWQGHEERKKKNAIVRPPSQGLAALHHG